MTTWYALGPVCSHIDSVQHIAKRCGFIPVGIALTFVQGYTHRGLNSLLVVLGLTVLLDAASCV